MGREELIKLIPIPGLAEYLDQVDKIMKKETGGGFFREHSYQLIERGGKRLRAMLLISSASITGRRLTDRVLSSAAAIELVHQASLIHDDIIDRENPFSLEQAVLIGDYFIAAGQKQAVAASSEAVSSLATAIKLMCEGQAQQLSGAYKSDASDSFYLDTAAKKAGALFAAACHMGAAGSRWASELNQYGSYFGVAFQIIDDIVDLDFSRQYVPVARQAAVKYVNHAKRSLNKLPDSPLKDSLLDLPELYLRFALQ
jgi:geranylgeranyl pyrophosphate synthase